MAPAEKASLLGSQLDSKLLSQTLLNVVSSSSLLCLVSLSLGAILWPSVLLRLIPDLDTYGGDDP